MIEKIINTHKIKFGVLDELLPNTIDKIKDINIHIDLHSILEALYKENNYEETNWFNNSTNTIISSCIINLVAHYRMYFYKNKISTKFFLYFANKRPRNNATYLTDYGYKFFDKYSKDNEDFKPINKEISYTMKLIKLIVEYIPSVYYIHCENIEPMNACGNMILKNKKTKNLILTKDNYWFQLVSLSNTEVLRLKRDNSYVINKENVISNILGDASYENKFVSHNQLSILYSFGGIKSRDVKGLTGYGYVKICKILDIAIEKGLITSSYSHIKNIIDEIYNGNQEEYLISIFKAIDLTYQLNELTAAQKEKIDNCVVDKFNKNDLIKLNDRVYTGEQSLMLIELFKGYESTKLDW